MKVFKIYRITFLKVLGGVRSFVHLLKFKVPFSNQPQLVDLKSATLMKLNFQWCNRTEQNCGNFLS